MTTFKYQVGNRHYAVELDRSGDGYRARVNGEDFRVEVIRVGESELTISVEEQIVTAYLAEEANRRWIFIGGKTVVLDLTPGANRRAQDQRGTLHASGEHVIVAPMPGQVRAVQAAEGDQVAKGQTLLLLEAMKMEIRIQSPRAGRLAKFSVQVGQTVERDQVLGEVV